MVIWGSQGDCDAGILEQIKHWFSKDLGCLFGKREFALRRYMIAIVENREDWLAAHRHFVQLLESHVVTSCLYVPRRRAGQNPTETVAEVIGFLSSVFLGNLKQPGESVFSSKLLLKCPVTEVPTRFPDFDLVGFYPHAMNPEDPLYDPSNDAPVICMNQASDIFGFATMCRELCINFHGQPPAEIGDRSKLEPVFSRAAGIWQEMARKTIENFGSRTDPSVLCPAHVSADHNFYVTQHDEAAFGETEKLEHFSEMPRLYLRRLVDEWLDFFSEGIPPRLDHVVRPALCPVKIRRVDARPKMPKGKMPIKRSFPERGLSLLHTQPSCPRSPVAVSSPKTVPSP